MTNPRARLRNRLYAVGLLPALVALLVAGQLLWRASINDDGLAAYDDRDLAVARAQFADRPGPEVVERWVAPFNEGGARFGLRDWTGAVDQWEAALEHAPEDRECDVRTNLALAHEQLAAQAVEDLDRGATVEAIEAGLAALDDCDTDDARSVRQRLKAAQGATGGEPEEQPDPTAPQPPQTDPKADPKAGELEKRNQQAEDNQQTYDDLEDYPSGEWSDDYQW